MKIALVNGQEKTFTDSDECCYKAVIEESSGVWLYKLATLSNGQIIRSEHSFYPMHCVLYVEF